MTKRYPVIEEQHNPELLSAACKLVLSGKLAVTTSGLVYLDIDDAYIHQLFPLISCPPFTKPDYFSDDSSGAHITVMYPEENIRIESTDLGQKYDFVITQCVTAQLNNKIYFILMIESPALLQLRKKYGLADLLNFRGYVIGFHITIGVSNRIY